MVSNPDGDTLFTFSEAGAYLGGGLVLMVLVTACYLIVHARWCSRSDHAAHGAFELGGTIMKNRIRMLRAEKGWSQAELAEHVHVSRNSINAVENGKFDPSLPLAFRVADSFGLAVSKDAIQTAR